LWAAFLIWVADYHVGDLASISGVLISVIGFILTVYNVRRSRKAAELARDAAQSAKNSIQTFETVVDLSTVIGLLEEIKRSHRNNQWALLPDRYAALRKTLISVRKKVARPF
jgi:ABC-type protease/lipase transport system fused ATPase/permease subunit